MSLFSALPEDFLHYVWRNRQFRHQALQTIVGEPVYILSPGIWNHNQGPDFSQAKVRIGTVNWYGHIEIHLHSRDWYQHGHDADPQYNNTILHVVLESDGRPIFRADNSQIPEIVLTDRIDPTLIVQYQHFVSSKEAIPCGEQVKNVPSIYVQQWLDRMAIERLEMKAARFQAHLLKNDHDWEQVLWEELLAAFGSTVNGELFRMLGQRLPYRQIHPFAQQALAREAVLFGMAGLLEGKLPIGYPQQLQQEWRYLQSSRQWADFEPLPFRFSRMRPAQFPTIRLSQLGELLAGQASLMRLIEPSAIAGWTKREMATTTYWESHIRFGHPASTRKRRVGTQQKNMLLINVLLPLSWAYGKAHGLEQMDQFEETLSQIKAENNKITRQLTRLGFPNQDAFQSQALLQSYTYYCQAHACLHCTIGQKILGKAENLLTP